jgi:membrane-bound serine protease (ClpP class)
MQLLLDSEFYSSVFIGLGLIFLFLEVFIPSGGILGILALGCGAFGIWGLFHQGHAAIGFAVLVGNIAVVVLGLRFGLRRLSSTASLDPRTTTSVDEGIGGLLGKEGVTTTQLRPAGVAVIGGKRIDVVSPGHFIAQNVRIRVVDNTGNRVVVREVAATWPEAAPGAREQVG